MKIILYSFISLLFFASCFASVKADNSAVNKTDQGVTAENQGTSEKDLQISKELRQALISDSTLSLYGQNVKIITINNEITLKGPVRSIKEKNLILSKAKKISGVSKVIDLTEIVAQ
jgi:osmotically-inducible protein OsmY